MPQVGSSGRRARRAAWSLLAAAALAVGCGSDKVLEGSLGEVIDLRYQSVEATLAGASLAISWQRAQGAGSDVVLKLVVDVAPDLLSGGGTMLLDPAADGTPKATLSRAVADDPVRDLAPVRHGELRLDGAPTLERTLSGEFRVTLGGDGVGEGRTVFGSFTTGRVAAAQ